MIIEKLSKKPPYDLIRITIAFLGKKKKAQGFFLTNKMLRDLGRLLHIENSLQFYYETIKNCKPIFFLKKIRKGKQIIDSPTLISERKANYIVLNWLRATINIRDTELFAKTIILMHNRDLTCETYRLFLDYTNKCKKALVNLRKYKENTLYFKFLRKKKKSRLFNNYKNNRL